MKTTAYTHDLADALNKWGVPFRVQHMPPGYGDLIEVSAPLGALENAIRSEGLRMDGVANESTRSYQGTRWIK